MDRTWRNRFVRFVVVLLLIVGGLANLIPGSARAQANPGGIAPDMSQTTLEWRDCATVYFGLSDYYSNLGDSACGALTVPENLSLIHISA